MHCWLRLGRYSNQNAIGYKLICYFCRPNSLCNRYSTTPILLNCLYQLCLRPHIEKDGLVKAKRKAGVQVKETERNLEGYVTSTCETSLEIDFRKISDGFTRANSFNPTLHHHSFPKLKTTTTLSELRNQTKFNQGSWVTHEACF